MREGNVNYIILCDRHEVEFTAEIMTIVFICLAIFVVVLGGDVLCSKTDVCARRQVELYIILCERHEVEFMAEIRTIVLLCLASFFSLILEGTYVVLKQDILCSAPG